MPIGNNSACSASVTAGAAAGGLPDEPPDARPACPVVWEGAGQPRPLPDSPREGRRARVEGEGKGGACRGGGCFGRDAVKTPLRLSASRLAVSPLERGEEGRLAVSPLERGEGG